MGGSYFGIIFSTTQIICISNFRSLSLIVNILCFFFKIHPGECDYICDYSIIVILGFVTSQTV